MVKRGEGGSGIPQFKNLDGPPFACGFALPTGGAFEKWEYGRPSLGTRSGFGFIERDRVQVRFWSRVRVRI